MNKQVEGIILNRNGVEDWTDFFAELHSSFKLQAKTWVLKKLTLGKKNFEIGLATLFLKNAKSD